MCDGLLSFHSLTGGHWPVKNVPRNPWNHQAMTVIAYSSAAGGPVRGILRLQHLSTSRNCAESKSCGARTMLKPSKCPHGKIFGVKSKKWIEKRGGKTEEEEHGVKCRKVTGDGGNVDFNGGSWRRCVKSRRNVTRMDIERKGAIKSKAESKRNQWKRWPFCLNMSKEGLKKTRRTHHQQLHVFLWFTILLFCPTMATSQVRKFNLFLIDTTKFLCVHVLLV